jgi:hypothetical protein
MFIENRRPQMDKYAKYMVRQYFLNQLIPPLESHKILGSNFLYDLVNMHIFFKLKSSRNSNPIKTEPIQEIQWDEIKDKCKEGYRQGCKDRQKLFQEINNFTMSNPTNIIIKLLIYPFQLFLRFITGCIILFFKLIGKAG